MGVARERVLIVGKYYAPFEGGIEFVTRQFAESLAVTYDVDVLVSAHDGRRGTEMVGPVRVIRLPTQATLLSQPISLGALARLRLRDYAVVQFHAPNPFVGALIWARLRLVRERTPLTLVHHMDIAGRAGLRAVLAPLYRDLARRAAWVAVTSARNRAVSRDLPRDARIVNLPLFVDRDAYPLGDAFRTQAAQWRRRTFGDAPLIGFVGRHAHYKGLDVLVRALTQLPEARCVIAGDGPLRAATIALAERLGLADRVCFPGALSHDEKCRLLGAVDVFAFPSTGIAEAFGVTQMEAMLLGAVVVASDLPTGVTDVAIDGETALLARPGDAGHLAQQIRRALGDAELRERLRAGAARHIEENFSRARILERMGDLTAWAVATGAET